MKNIFTALLILLLGACGDDYSEGDEPTELGSVEQELNIKPIDGWTLGFDGALLDKSRCRRDGSTSQQCYFVRPKVDDATLPYLVFVPPGAFGNYESMVLQELDFYRNEFTRKINVNQPRGYTWSFNRTTSGTGFNIILETTTSLPKPAFGETRWEKYIKVTFPNIGTTNCRTLTESVTEYPGGYYACKLISLQIDYEDLIATHDPVNAQRHLSQAIEYAVFHLALGISGTTTAGRRLEVGAVNNSVLLNQNELDSLRQRPANVSDTPFVSPYTDIFFLNP